MRSGAGCSVVLILASYRRQIGQFDFRQIRIRAMRLLRRSANHFLDGLFEEAALAVRQVMRNAPTFSRSRRTAFRGGETTDFPQNFFINLKISGCSFALPFAIPFFSFRHVFKHGQAKVSRSRKGFSLLTIIHIPIEHRPRIRIEEAKEAEIRWRRRIFTEPKDESA